MKTKLILILLILYFLNPLVKAEGDDLCHYSTEGTDFWFGFMENRLVPGNAHYLEITVTSRFGAQLTLTYGPNNTPIPIPEPTVRANQSVTIPLDYHQLESIGSELIENKGIHLTSTAPVNVYALNYATKSSDVAVIYPAKSLGNEYFAMCYTPPPISINQSNSEFLIVASEDNTIVKITPSVDTDQKHKAGIEFSDTLQKGQSYQVQSMNSNVSGQGDLTGSFISSNKPIAFYSGVKANMVPVSGSTRDHLYEQIPPISTWGKDFYVVPLKLRSKDTYRVLAAEDGTSVFVEGSNTTLTLNRGRWTEFELSSSQASRIISNKRILLAQYCRSQAVDGRPGVGDPFMMILSSVGQKINEVTFEAYKSALITNIFFVNIITLTSEIDALSLDGGPIGSYFKPFPNSLYSYAQMPIAKGTRTLKNDHTEGGFLAYVYGFGESTESYGYGVGFNLDIQVEISGNFIGDTMVVCSGTEQELEASGNFDRFEWSTNENKPSIMVSKEGLYTVKAFTAAGCEKSAWVYVKVDDPKVDLGNDLGSCMPGKIVLDAGPGFSNYLWQDGSTNQTFVVEKTGTYSVTVISENGCKASDEVEAFVFEPSFTQNYSVATDQHPEITFFNQTEHAISYLWDFGDGNTSTEIHPVHSYSKVGEYTVTLVATSEFGCSDTIRSSVKIIPFKLLAPNAFRPDSEIEKNRFFAPVAEGADPESYRLQIFSRLGSTVYETRNPETGWDGELSNGSLAGAGIYVWIVNYLDVQGYPHREKGTVMLVR